RVKLGQKHTARERLAAVRQRYANDLVPHMLDAMLDIDAGDGARAERKLREIVQRCPDYPGVAGTLASVLFPGPNYREVLQHLHQQLKPRSYLEIGVETGATLSLAKASIIVGVDPDLSPLRRERVAAHAQLFEMTSQTFFESVDRRALFGNTPLDFIFIDGLHRHAAALHDFLAVERWVHRDTVVVMHDALPIAPVYAEPERRTRFWVGDVWKAIYVLLKQRQDLRIRIVPTVPSGLVVVRWNDIARVARAPQEVVELADQSFPSLDDPLTGAVSVWPREFPLVSNDARGYAEALGR
ncbi:MAG TPA: class I SAM-dependent methyltransferase, partial [Polyangiaceae bacterium]